MSTETNRTKTLLAEWAKLDADKKKQIEADLAELEQYRSTGLNPVQVRALNNMLTVMRTFLSAVDNDDAFAPMPPINHDCATPEDFDKFWSDFYMQQEDAK